MLIDEWQKFKGWTVLEFFLSKQKRIHLKGLARALEISPRTAQTYLQLYEKEGILEKENIGNLTLYNLADSPLTRELRRMYLLLRITSPLSKFAAENPWVTGIVLYGSSARGDYDSSSDIDLLIISTKKELGLKRIKEMENVLGKEVKMEIMSIGDIRRLAEKQDNFYKSVLKNNIQLYGAAI